MTDNAPPTAPKLYMAVGMDRTPVAKMTFRKMTVAFTCESIESEM